ncbi:hypothetical protein GCM10022376_32060 [Yimella lutea]
MLGPNLLQRNYIRVSRGEPLLEAAALGSSDSVDVVTGDTHGRSAYESVRRRKNPTGCPLFEPGRSDEGAAARAETKARKHENPAASGWVLVVRHLG